MTITADNIGLRYTREFIFKNLSYEFQSGFIYAILGPNGSGKSSLMKVLSGYVTPSKGKVTYSQGNKAITGEEVYSKVVFCSPYIEIIEEFTLLEQLAFQAKFKPFLNSMSVHQVMEALQLGKHADKQISNFSSGMKQRVKLGLTILSNAEVLLLDEPATNLDTEGVIWYHKLLKSYATNKIVIIASNRQDEYEMADERLNILDFK